MIDFHRTLLIFSTFIAENTISQENQQFSQIFTKFEHFSKESALNVTKIHDFSIHVTSFTEKSTFSSFATSVAPTKFTQTVNSRIPMVM